MATLDKGDRVWGAFSSSMDTPSYVSGDSFSEEEDNSDVLLNGKDGAASSPLASNETLFERFNQWANEPLSFLGSVSRDRSPSFFDNRPQDMQTRDIIPRRSFEEVDRANWPQGKNRKSSTSQTAHSVVTFASTSFAEFASETKAPDQSTSKRQQVCSNCLDKKRVKITRASSKDNKEFSIEDYQKCLNQFPVLKKQKKGYVSNFLASHLNLPLWLIIATQDALKYQNLTPAQKKETQIGKYLALMSRQKKGSTLGRAEICEKLGGISTTTLYATKKSASLVDSSVGSLPDLETCPLLVERYQEYIKTFRTKNRNDPFPSCRMLIKKLNCNEYSLKAAQLAAEYLEQPPATQSETSLGKYRTFIMERKQKSGESPSREEIREGLGLTKSLLAKTIFSDKMVRVREIQLTQKTARAKKTIK